MRAADLAAFPIGLGLAALGRPAYITGGRAADLPDRSVAALRARTSAVLDAAYAAGMCYVDAARSRGRAEEFLAGWLAERGHHILTTPRAVERFIAPADRWAGGPSGPCVRQRQGVSLRGQGEVNLQLTGTLRALRIIAAAILAGGLAACGTARTSDHPVAAGPARTAAVPVRVQPNAVGWSRMVPRPDHIYVGMGGAPILRQLAWRNWGGPRAWARGKLDIYWPQPGPISSWHPTTYPVTVRLQDILTHNGQPSYRKMADFYVNRRGAAKVLYFRFHVLPGGSVPGWNPS